MRIEDVYRGERKMSHRAMRVPDDDPATAKMRATILNGTTVVIGYFFAVFFRRRILAPLYVLAIELYCASLLWTDYGGGGTVRSAGR
jgi:hypothetical protein